MNAPFKPDKSKIEPFDEVLATACVSISKLKANPAAVVAEAQKREVAILSRNRAVAYVISPQVWDYLTDLVADMQVERDAMEELAAMEAGDDETVEIDLARYL